MTEKQIDRKSSNISFFPRINTKNFLFQVANIFLFMALPLMYSCTKTENKTGDSIVEVNIIEAFNKKENIGLSNIIDGRIEYVPLESKKEILLSDILNVYANDSVIIAFSKNQVYLFNRKTGKFIREIGHYGKDPGGYKKVGHSFQFDEETNLVYTSGWDPKSYFRYSLNGEMADKVTAQTLEIEEDIMNNIFGEIITSIAPLNDTSYVGYVWNIDGKQKAKLIVFNEDNGRIKIYPQYKKFDYDINRDGISVFSWNAKFYKLNNQLHFFERFTDTVFTATMAELKPKYVLRLGMTEEATASNYSANRGEVEYFLVEDIFESNRFLFFKTQNQQDNYFGFYDKKTQQTKILENAEGLENDIDNFLPFNLKATNKNNEIITWCDAYKILEWFSENPEKAASLPPQLKKLGKLNENNNPVIMIAKIKE